MTNDLRTQIAAVQHTIQSKWVNWMFNSACQPGVDGTLVIPKEKVDRWIRQAGTEYAQLSEEEKGSDRHQTALILEVVDGADFIEELSDLQHEFWNDWIIEMFAEWTIWNANGTCIILSEFVQEWKSRASKSHPELDDEAQERCLIEADKIIAVINN